MKKNSLFKYVVLTALLAGNISCSVLPPVRKVNPGNIRTNGVLFMLPKAEVYLDFLKYRTDSVKGLLAGYPNLVSKLNELYAPFEPKKVVKNTCSTFKYSNFQFIEKLVQDTSQLFSVDISKDKKHLFTNLDFCLSLSDDGLILGTDISAENQTADVLASMGGFAFNAIVPHLPFNQNARSAGDTIQLAVATKLFDSLKALKNIEKKIVASHKWTDGDSAPGIPAYIIASENKILKLLLGKSNTRLADSLEIPVNVNNDTIYVCDDFHHHKHSFTILSGMDGENSDYLFKIECLWLTTFSNADGSQKSSGLPFKMPERLKLNIYSPSNELIAYTNMILPSKSTFFLPDKLGASKSKLKVDYNPNGTIRVLSAGFESINSDEAKSNLTNFDPTLIKSGSSNK